MNDEQQRGTVDPAAAETEASAAPEEPLEAQEAEEAEHVRHEVEEDLEPAPPVSAERADKETKRFLSTTHGKVITALGGAAAIGGATLMLF